MQGNKEGAARRVFAGGTASRQWWVITSHHITSRHFMPGKYSIVSGGRKWVPGYATMIGARGHARATFSHFLTRQLHHFLSGYRTYVMQHSRRLSPRAEPFDHVWWCQRVVWYPRIFQKTSHSSRLEFRFSWSLPFQGFQPVLSRYSVIFFSLCLVFCVTALGEFIDCGQ